MEAIQYGKFTTFFQAAGFTEIGYEAPKGSVYELTLGQQRAVDHKEFQIEPVAGENLLLRNGRIYSSKARGNVVGD